jgi:hypothetical protein
MVAEFALIHAHSQGTIAFSTAHGLASVTGSLTTTSKPGETNVIGDAPRGPTPVMRVEHRGQVRVESVSTAAHGSQHTACWQGWNRVVRAASRHTTHSDAPVRGAAAAPAVPRPPPLPAPADPPPHAAACTALSCASTWADSLASRRSAISALRFLSFSSCRSLYAASALHRAFSAAGSIMVDEKEGEGVQVTASLALAGRWLGAFPRATGTPARAHLHVPNNSSLAASIS